MNISDLPTRLVDLPYEIVSDVDLHSGGILLDIAKQAFRDHTWGFLIPSDLIWRYFYDVFAPTKTMGWRLIECFAIGDVSDVSSDCKPIGILSLCG